jgi:DNA-binding transcriptional ArsR family regulator
MPEAPGGEFEWIKNEEVEFDVHEILESADSFLDYLRARFDESLIHVNIEVAAYSLLLDPPAMKDLIITHFQLMWDKYLRSEWARIEPMLDSCVDVIHGMDLSEMDMVEAARHVTGHEMTEEKWPLWFENVERLVLVPHAHSGPYLGKSYTDETIWLFFGARIPEGVSVSIPELSHADIVVRLDALADDNRLRILRLISEHGELRSQEVIESLGLSQSAASRHLKQLSATGYLSERRCEGAKCYELNPERIKLTLDAISRYLITA